MGTVNSKKTINNECPICYKLLNSNSIILDCGHSFNPYCIQKHCFTKLYNSIKPLCPLCNTKIKNHHIKKITSVIFCLENDPNEWFRKDIIRISEIKKNFRINFFNFNDLILCTPNKFNTHFYMTSPIYFYSPTFTTMKIIDHSIFNTIFYKKTNNNFNSTPELILALECEYQNKIYSYWKRFLIILNNKLKKIYDTTPISDEFLISNKKMRFFISNPSEINYANKVTGDIRKGFDLSEDFNGKKFKIQFQPLIYIINKKCFIINKITGVLVI